MSKFKALAKEVNFILKRDFNISLNFKGYDELISDYEVIESIDLYSLNELIKDATEWGTYFSELRNFLIYYEDLYKIKIDVYDYLLFTHKKDIKSKNKEKLLNNDIKKKYKILKSTDSDILEELEIKMKQSKLEYNIIKSFNNILSSRIKLFEKIFYVSVRQYGKNLYELHFK